MIGFVNTATKEQLFPSGAFVELIPPECATNEPHVAFFVQFNDAQAYLDFEQNVQDAALRQHRCAFGTAERHGVNVYVIDNAMLDNERLSCLVQVRPVERVNDVFLPTPTNSLYVASTFSLYDYRTKEQVFLSHSTSAMSVVDGLARYGSPWRAVLFYPDGNSANDAAILDQLRKSRRVLRLNHSNLYPFTIGSIAVREDCRTVTITFSPVFRS